MLTVGEAREVRLSSVWIRGEKCLMVDGNTMVQAAHGCPAGNLNQHLKSATSCLYFTPACHHTVLVPSAPVSVSQLLQSVAPAIQRQFYQHHKLSQANTATNQKVCFSLPLHAIPLFFSFCSTFI